MFGLEGFWLGIAATFLVAIGIGISSIRAFRRKRAPVPRTNAVLRISNGSTIYRSQFIGVREEGWACTTPIQRDQYIPLRPGDLLTIETINDKGIAIYRTTLKKITAIPAMVIVDVPSIWNTDDRRDSKRLRNLGHLEAKLDGHRVGVLDVSVFGARLNSQKEMPCGERVRLEIQGLNQEVYGWVLACDRKGDRHTVRIRFEEELELATLQKAA